MARQFAVTNPSLQNMRPTLHSIVSRRARWSKQGRFAAQSCAEEKCNHWYQIKQSINPTDRSHYSENSQIRISFDLKINSIMQNLEMKYFKYMAIDIIVYIFRPHLSSACITWLTNMNIILFLSQYYRKLVGLSIKNENFSSQYGTFIQKKNNTKIIFIVPSQSQR